MTPDPRDAGARPGTEPPPDEEPSAPESGSAESAPADGPPPGDAPTRQGTLSIHTASAWGRTTWTGDAEDEGHFARLRNVRLKLLGQGGQGQVYLVEHLGQLEAHKFLNRPGADKSIFREALHTRLVDHPNIVKVFGTEEVDGAAVLRMEYVEGRDMARVVDEDGILPTARLAALALQVADALRAAHEVGIVHQDLKPSNLILDEKRERVVVTDFGVSAALRTAESASAARGGTPIFMSPDLLEGRAGATPSSDVWSLGVTLYYLATGGYPFPFDELSPAEAVHRPPRDPRPDAPHVSDAFWRVLARTLESDPARAYDSMADVHRDLDAVVRTLSCPECGAREVLEPAPERCGSCGSERFAPWAEAARARAEAETALALCSFAEAEANARAAAAACRAAGREEDARSADALARAATERGRACDRELDALGEDIEARRWVEAVARLDGARRRFSRSPRLAVLRSRLREGLRSLHDGTEPEVAAALRRGAFDRARAAFARLRRVLDDERARAALERALERVPEDPAWLEEEIHRKEAHFRELSDETDRAIAEFDFDRALARLARREDEFPSEENVRLMSRLRRAREDLARARRYAPEDLEALAREPLAPRGGERLELVSAVAACRRILTDFPVSAYPTFEEIAALERRLEIASTAVHETVQEHLVRAREAEEAQLVGAALETLDAVRERVAESDLFPASTREDLQRARARLVDAAERARELWRDGQSARDRREYAQALLALRELLRVAPHDYPEARAVQAEVETVRDRAASLSEQVAREFAEIRRGRFTPESARLALQNAESLWEISDDDRRDRLDADLGEALRVLLGSQREHLALSGGAGPDEATAFLAEALVPLAGAVSTERFLAALEREPRVGEDLAALGATGFEEAGAPLEERLTAVAGRRTVLEPLAPLFRSSAPTTCAPAGRVLAERVFASFRRAPRAARKRALAEASALLRDLEVLVAPGDRDLHRRTADRLRRMGTRAVWARVAERGARLVVLGAPLVAVGAVGWLLGREWGVDARERERTEKVGGWVEALGLGELPRFQAERWLGPAPAPDRIALLRNWNELRDRPESAAGWSALALLDRRDLLAESAGPELLAVFDADVAGALERAAGATVAAALGELSARRSAGHGEAAALADALAAYARALERAAPGGGALDRLRVAVGGLADSARSAGDGAAWDAALAAGDLPQRVAARRATLRAEPGPGPLSPETHAAFAGWQQAMLARLLVARLDDLTGRAMLGEVDGYVARSAALVEALAPLCGDGWAPPAGTGPAARAVDAALAPLRGE